MSGAVRVLAEGGVRLGVGENFRPLLRVLPLPFGSRVWLGGSGGLCRCGGVPGRGGEVPEGGSGGVGTGAEGVTFVRVASGVGCQDERWVC